jgi:hypothetical protein
MKVLPAELFRSDGLTVVTKLLVAFRSFGNAPKSVIQIGVHVVSFRAP